MKMVKSRHGVHEEYSQHITVEKSSLWTHRLHGVSSCALELVDTTVMGSCSTCFLSEGKMRDTD